MNLINGNLGHSPLGILFLWKGSSDLVGVSAEVAVSAVGVWPSGSEDCFSLFGDGADLASCCFSNSPDTTGESMLFSDFGV
jgi:hypothetical protein